MQSWHPLRHHWVGTSSMGTQKVQDVYGKRIKSNEWGHVLYRTCMTRTSAAGLGGRVLYTSFFEKRKTQPKPFLFLYIF